MSGLTAMTTQDKPSGWASGLFNQPGGLGKEIPKPIPRGIPSNQKPMRAKWKTEPQKIDGLIAYLVKQKETNEYILKPRYSAAIDKLLSSTVGLKKRGIKNITLDLYAEVIGKEINPKQNYPSTGMPIFPQPGGLAMPMETPGWNSGEGQLIKPIRAVGDNYKGEQGIDKLAMIKSVTGPIGGMYGNPQINKFWEYEVIIPQMFESAQKNSLIIKPELTPTDVVQIKEALVDTEKGVSVEEPSLVDKMRTIKKGSPLYIAMVVAGIAIIGYAGYKIMKK